MNQVVIVLVHAIPLHASAIRDSLEAAGYLVELAVDLVEAIDLMRSTQIAAMIAVVPRLELRTAASYLVAGEQFPPSLIVGDDRETVGIKARAVATLSNARTPEHLLLCLRTMLDFVGPRSDNRTLPLRMTRVQSGKFSSWLAPPPGRAKHDSDWR